MRLSRVTETEGRRGREGPGGRLSRGALGVGGRTGYRPLPVGHWDTHVEGPRMEDVGGGDSAGACFGGRGTHVSPGCPLDRSLLRCPLGLRGSED